jgi:hypothetical protein
LVGLRRRSVFGRLAGDEDVNDAERLCPSFTYQARSWKKPRRLVAKVEWHPG